MFRIDTTKITGNEGITYIIDAPTMAERCIYLLKKRGKRTIPMDPDRSYSLIFGTQTLKNENISDTPNTSIILPECGSAGLWSR
jgi:hypothetical protein